MKPADPETMAKPGVRVGGWGGGWGGGVCDVIHYVAGVQKEDFSLIKT